MKKKFKGFPIHPFLFSIFNIFYYFAGLNLAQGKWELLLACVGTLLGTSLIWWIAYRITKKLFRSSVIASLVLLVCFQLDGIYEFFVGIKWMPHFINVFLTTLAGQYVLFLSLLLIVFLIANLWKKKSFKLGSFFLDIVALTLTVNMVLIVVQNHNHLKKQAADDAQSNTISWAEYSSDIVDQIHPTKSFDRDVYYLVFDAFGSQTTLNQLYGYSGIDLPQALTEKGFKVIEDGRTNYNQTKYSIPSTLNFSYIQQFNSSSLNSDFKDSVTAVLMNDGLLFKFFREHGYKVVTFATGLNFIDINSADYHLSPDGIPDFFTNELINNTFLALFYWKQQYLWNNLRIQYTINELGGLSEMEDPIFVYAHILLPHPPFVYQGDGEVKIPAKKFDYRDNSAFTMLDEREVYIEGYRNQAEYAAAQVIKIVTEIHEKSPDAIIIVQGDHGPGAYYEQEDPESSNLDEKAHILNAYYFPDGDYSEIPDDITPVNSFRVILNHFFGTDMELLPNATYFSTYNEPFLFIDVTSQLR